MKKKVIASKLTHTSHLGKAVFKNVPVWVDESFPANNGDIVTLDEKRDNPAVPGDCSMMMEREVAKLWLREKAELRSKKLKVTPRDVLGIQTVLQISSTEFALLLGISKSAVSRHLKGSLVVQESIAKLMILFLSLELMRPGSAQKAVQQGAMLTPSDKTVAEPQFDFKKLHAA